MENSTKLILVRHGETDYNLEKRYQGQLDTALNPNGQHQAECLAAALQNIKIDICFSSPLQRALRTAEIAASLHQLPIHTDRRLMEIHHGAWQGMQVKDIQREYPKEYTLWQEEPWKLTMPQGGESLKDIENRTMDLLHEILPKNQGRTLLFVSHGAINSVLLCKLLGFPWERIHDFPQDNACINILKQRGDGWEIEWLNDTRHLKI